MLKCYSWFYNQKISPGGIGESSGMPEIEPGQLTLDKCSSCYSIILAPLSIFLDCAGFEPEKVQSCSMEYSR